MNYCILIFLFLSLLACNGAPANKSSASSTGSESSVVQNAPKLSLDSNETRVHSIDESDIGYNLRNSRGLIRTNNESALKANSLLIYNKDGSVWYEFQFSSANNTQQSTSDGGPFRPFRYDPSEHNVAFNLIGETARYYEVIVNEESGITKYVKKDDPILRRGTWDQYILECFAVGFDSRSNPLSQNPNGQPADVVSQKSETFHPEKISGNWLKVQWRENDDEKRPARSGWIRWKEDNRIVIELFETA